MSTRSKARKAALDFLYESDIRNRPVLEILQVRVTELDYPVRDLTRDLVTGVSENKERIDEIIAMRAKGWDLDRMPVLDRNILRLGTFEILWSDTVPVGVAIDEAVELAKTLSTEDSPSYINGVLSAVAEIKGEISI